MGNKKRMVQCVKLNKELEGLERQTIPGELGKKIFDSVSKEAWQQWLLHQTMLINEYHLSMIDPKARKFLNEELEKFLFSGEEISKPEGYKPPTS